MILIGAILFGLVLFFSAGDGAYIPEPGDVILFEEGPALEPEPVDEPDPVPVEPAEDPAPEPEGTPDSSSAFTYYASGDLKSGTGTGVNDTEVYAPNILFPIKEAEVFLNSQYYNHGGFGYSGEDVDGGRCAPSNYAYPWRDNFCETRWRDSNTRNCEKDKVHSGVDIRVGSAALCQIADPKPIGSHKDIEIIAPEDGYISYIDTGGFYFKLNTGSRIYTFLHVNMSELTFEELDDVVKGQKLTYASNSFPDKTTIHLHLNLRANIDGEGMIFVSPYMSMVRAYEARNGEVGTLVSD
jgi:hypothetical protein